MSTTDVDYPPDALALAVQAVAASRVVDQFDGDVEVTWTHHPRCRAGGAVLYATASVKRSSVVVLGRAHEPQLVAS